MTIIEMIIRGVQSLPMREQVEVARFVQRLGENDGGQERADVLRRTYGILDEADVLAFEHAMKSTRRLEAYG